MTVLLLALHFARRRLTLAPFFGLAGVFSMMQWQLLQTGWWVRIGEWNFNAGHALFVPTLLLGAVITYALDGLKLARAYFFMVLTTSSAAWLFSVFREVLAQYVPLPYLLVLSNREHLAIIAALALGQGVGIMGYALLQTRSGRLAMPLATLAGVLCWVSAYSLLNFGTEMGLANVYNDAPPLLAASLPMLAGAVLYGEYAVRKDLLMPWRPAASLLAFWRPMKDDNESEDPTSNRDRVVSELRLLNQRLARNSDLMDTHLAQASFGILIADTTGEVVRCNPALELVPGFQAAKGQHLCPLIEKAAGLRTAMETLATDLSNRRWRLTTPDDRPCWVEFYVTALGDSGRPGNGGLYVIVKDVTEAVLDEQRRLASSRVKEIHQTGRVLTHDFSNLLIGAQAHNQQLRQRVVGDRDALASLDAVDAALRHAAEMLVQIGGSSQFGTPRLRVVALKAMLDDAVAICQATADEGGVQLRQAPAGLWRVEVDASQMVRVFTNLIRNAIRASPPGSEVAIAVAPRGHGVEVSIADQGCGLSDPELAQAFDPGFSTKGEGKGGLGLAVSYLMVDAHGGHLELRRNAAGGGLCATVWLPERPLSPSLSGLDGQQVIVLGAEDHVAPIVAELEVERGCTVAVAIDRDEVIALIQDDPGWKVLLVADNRVVGDWLEGLPRQVELRRMLTETDP